MNKAKNSEKNEIKINTMESGEINKETKQSEISHKDMNHGDMKSGSYAKFALMMATSFVIMYAVMFLNVAEFDHIYLSMMRFYMTILMVAPMAVVMLLFMRGMYKNKKVNMGILAGSILLFAGTFFFMRTQTFIVDRQWMRGMIPHHSSAILTSSNADLSDPEAKKLAEDIIKAQEKEIALMKRLLEKTD
jgi:hypothetical protein